MARRIIDLPVFLLANVVVDFEPLLVMVFRFDYPLHGYAHTFLFGGMLGILWGLAAFGLRGIIGRGMAAVKLQYEAGLIKGILSGVLGVWFHVLLDSPLYSDIRPFYPLPDNPLYGIFSVEAVYLFCALCFIPAAALYFAVTRKGSR